MVHEERIIYEHIDIPSIHTLDVFCQYDGYKRFETAIKQHRPQEIAELVFKSGITYLW